MTISSSTRTAGPFLGDGSTTALPFGFKVFATTDVLVQRTSADGAQLALTLGGDYTVALNADQNAAPGGVVTLLDPAADFPTGSSITLTSAVAATQPLSLANGGPFLAKSIEDALDRLTLLLQQQALSLDGAVRAPLVETLTELPAATARRGKMMAFDPSTGDPVLPSFTITQVANAVAAAYASGLVLPFLNVLDYGAVGDGTTDDTAAIQAAIDSSYGADVYFPPGTYRVTAPLLLNTQGAILRGGNHRVTTLMIDQTTGPGINISQPYCQVIGLTVKASTTRQAYTTGSTYELVPNLFGIQIYNNGGYLTQTRIERVWSFGHPNNGFYMGGEGADSMFINCAAYSNRGHGFYFDGRALLGGTASRCGLVSLIHCRGTDNGGNALFADDPAAMCYRMWIYSFETIKNAWNTAIAGLVNAELHIGGENQHLQQCAQSDENGDTATIMDQGLWPRLAKATASVGIFIGAECGGITITQNRFIGTRKGVETALTVDRLHLYVRGAYFSHQKTSGGLSLQSRGFDIGADYKCLDIECETAMPVSIMVSTPTTGGRIKIGNDEYIIYGASLGSLFALRLYRDATIASEAVNAQSAYINLLATATTDLKAISFAGISNPLPSGMTVHFYNASAYTITLKNSLSPGFIRTVSGTDTPVLPGRGFSIRVSPAGDPHEI